MVVDDPKFISCNVKMHCSFLGCLMVDNLKVLDRYLQFYLMIDNVIESPLHMI